jgi:hypothetical protein
LWSLWLYSKYFTVMNVAASASVTTSEIESARRFPSWAARTDHAAERLLEMSTAVFVAPSRQSRNRLAYRNSSGWCAR